MDENLTDQQRAEQVRGWLREYGGWLLLGLVGGVGAVFGYLQWSSYNSGESERASALYDELVTAIRVDRTTRAEELTAELASDFASSPYLAQARLAMARVKMERSQPAEAVKYLEEVVRAPGSPEIANIAKLRLARVLIQEEKYDEALKTLEIPGDSAFAPRFHEARGDAYYAQGKLDDARKEYEAAVKGSDATSGDQAFLQAKLAEVSGGALPVDSAAAAPSGE